MLAPPNQRAMDAATWAAVASAVAGAVGAIGARSSARASRDAVRRSNMPFVWPSYEVDYGEEDPATGMQVNTVRVTLHNDGPGIAIDVRWSMWSPTDAPSRRWMPAQWRWLPARWRRPLARWGRDAPADADAAATASKAIRAMQAGDEVASADTVQFLEDNPAWVVVRYSDSAGERWEYVDPAAPRELAGHPVPIPKWDRW